MENGEFDDGWCHSRFEGFRPDGAQLRYVQHFFCISSIYQCLQASLVASQAYMPLDFALLGINDHSELLGIVFLAYIASSPQHT